jgi:hypothetical protein
MTGKEGEPISRCYGAVLSWIASARSPRHQGHPVHGLRARRPLPTTPVPVPLVAEVAVPPLPPDMCSRSHEFCVLFQFRKVTLTAAAGSSCDWARAGPISTGPAHSDAATTTLVMSAGGDWMEALPPSVSFCRGCMHTHTHRHHHCPAIQPRSRQLGAAAPSERHAQPGLV